MQKTQRNKMHAEDIDKEQTESNYNALLESLDENQRVIIKRHIRATVAQRQNDVIAKILAATNETRERISIRREGANNDDIPAWTEADIENIASLKADDIDAFLRSKYSAGGKKKAPGKPKQS